MGLTPRVARFVYGTVGALALVLTLVRVQAGFWGGAAFSFAIAAFAAFRFYQLSQQE